MNVSTKRLRSCTTLGKRSVATFACHSRPSAGRCKPRPRRRSQSHTYAQPNTGVSLRLRSNAPEYPDPDYQSRYSPLGRRQLCCSVSRRFNFQPHIIIIIITDVLFFFFFFLRVRFRSIRRSRVSESLTRPMRVCAYFTVLPPVRLCSVCISASSVTSARALSCVVRACVCACVRVCVTTRWILKV